MARKVRTTGTREICLRMEIRAPVAEVWRAIVEPDQIAAWNYMERVELDSLRVGGTYRFHCGNGGIDTATILRLEAPRRLVYRWRSREPAPTVVEYRLRRRAGGTLLEFRNGGFRGGPGWDRAYRDDVEGWADIHASLIGHVEGGLPKRNR